MSTAVQMAAIRLADFLMGSAPGNTPFRAVALVLSLAAHRRVGAPQAAELHRRIRLNTGLVNKGLRKKFSLDYDPLDVIEFDSFSSLLKKKPKGGTPWRDILLVTHAQGEMAPGFAGEIYFGSEVFVMSRAGTNDLLDAMNRRRPAVDAFQKGFAKSCTITLIACGGGAAGPEIPVYVRELFDTDGLIKTPTRNVDFNKLGQLMVLKDPDDPRKELRPIKKDEWLIVPARDAILSAVDPLPPEDWEDF